MPKQRSAILDGLARQARPRRQGARRQTAVFRRYLKTVSAEHFAVDETRVAEDARF